MGEQADLTALIISAAVRMGTPVLLATTGEILAQRSGIVNLGLEGAMLLGAVTAAWAYLSAGSLLLALIAATLAGGLLGLAHATLVVLAGIGMLASGICLFFVGRGLSAFWGQQLVGQQLPGLAQWNIPLLSDIPVIGEAFFAHDVLVYLAVVIACGAWYILFRTRLGLMIRATGEDASVARAEGVPVTAVRLVCVTVGSGLAGLAGAYIALEFAHTWLEGLAAGRGWVAIGLVILARWNPLYASPVAYLFGGVMAIQLNAQAAGIEVSPYLLSSLPYIFTVIALAGAHLWAGGSGMPAELTRAEN